MYEPDGSCERPSVSLCVPLEQEPDQESGNCPADKGCQDLEFASLVLALFPADNLGPL